MRVVIVSLGTARLGQLRADVAELSAADSEVDLIVTKAEAWTDLPANVRVHAVGTIESRHPLLRFERIVVLRLPRLAYQFGTRVLSIPVRVLPGRAGRLASGVARRWKAAWTRTKHRTDHFHKERFGSWYGQVRPFVLWRVSRRAVLPTLNFDVEAPELILFGDGLSTPTAWHLAQAHPRAGVGPDLKSAILDRDRFGDRTRAI